MITYDSPLVNAIRKAFDDTGLSYKVSQNDILPEYQREGLSRTISICGDDANIVTKVLFSNDGRNFVHGKDPQVVNIVLELLDKTSIPLDRVQR